MKTLVLLLLLASGQAAFGFTEFQPGINDLRPVQVRGERQTSIKKIRCEGVEYGVMYEQGGIQIGKPEVTGLCSWANTDSLANCAADRKTPATARCWAIAQKYYGLETKTPTMSCSNASFDFKFRIIDKQIELTTSTFRGIGEAEGLIFKPVAKSLIKITATGSPICPLLVNELTATGRDLKLCFAIADLPTSNLSTAGTSNASFSMIQDGKKVDFKETALNCVPNADFNEAVSPLIEKSPPPAIEEITPAPRVSR